MDQLHNNNHDKDTGSNQKEEEDTKNEEGSKTGTGKKNQQKVD